MPNPHRHLIRQASKKFPISKCYITAGWQDSDLEEGLFQVVVARRQDSNLTLFGTYLVDTWCLGVKDAMAHAFAPLRKFRKEFLPKLYSTQGGFVSCSPDLAHQMIYQAIDYAGQFGFEPHRDFKLARCVLDKRGVHPEPHDITFGRDGKPFYVAGPYDDARAILLKLRNRLGPDGFHYVIPIDPSSELFPFGDDMPD